MSFFDQNFIKNAASSSNFQPLTPSIRPSSKKVSKLVQHVEKDKKSKRTEIEGLKSDPFKFLQPEDINEYAEIGLEMFQKSLTLCSSDSNFNTVVRSIKRLNLGKYVDEAFPPSLKSLVGENLIIRAPWRAFVWLPSNQFCPNVQISKFQNGEPFYSPDEVRQGLIGDGYLIAVLASLAENSQRIFNLFTMKMEQSVFGKEHGVYAVKLYHAGKPIEVVLDDYFPCISDVKGSAFAVCEGYLWPLIIEKAFAKLFFSYDNIEKAVPAESFRDLTGAPAKSLYTDEEDKLDQLWAQLCVATEKKWPMTACTKDFEKGIDYIDEQTGLISDHTYSCLGGLFLNGIKLVKLRTVVSNAIWKGKWSIHSETNEWDSIPDKFKYLSELKEKKYVFYIGFKDFVNFFESVQFCYMNDKFKYSFNAGKFNKKKGKYFKVTVTEPGKYWFTVSQEDVRNYPKSYKEKFDQKYPNITLVIGQLIKFQGKKEVKYVASNMLGKRDLFCSPDQDLEAGEYLVYIKILWLAGEENEATLSVYGAGSCRIDEELHFVYDDYFLESVWLDYSLKYCKSEKISLKTDGAPNSEYCIEKTLHGYAYIAVWNREKNKKITCEFRIKQLNELNMRLKAAFCGKDIAVFELKPYESRLVLIRCKKYGEFGDLDNEKICYSSSFKVELI